MSDQPLPDASVLEVRGVVDHLRGAHACGGRFVLDEPLFGAPEESVWTGSGDDGRVLVTLGLSTGLTRAQLEEELGLPYPGISPLLAVGHLDRAEPEVDVVVEALPDGVLSPAGFVGLVGEERLQAARGLAGAVGRSAEAAHEDVVPIGGIRPDAVWVRPGEPDALVAVAPRATRVWALRQRGDAGVAPGHATVFEAPELLDGAAATRPDDVFSLAASFWWWGTGQHPFSSEGRDAQLEPVLSASLGPRVGRPSLETLVELIAP